MSDLTERLRAHMGKAEIKDVLPDCREAADEIERLNRELAEAREALDEKEIASGLTSDGNLWRYWAAKAKDLALKNAALERALKEKP